MNKFAHTVLVACLATSSMVVFAEDSMKKDDGMMKAPTMQDCKDHSSMSDKGSAKKNDEMGKKCASMMKKHDGMKKDDGMKEDGMKNEGAASGAMK